MPRLSAFLPTKNTNFPPAEQNLEQGRIFLFTSGNQFGNAYCSFCWKPSSAGIAQIEIWGASGSSAKMCCCGFGLPGNPGAYSKKTIRVTTSSYVCGMNGKACANADDLCFRGCSDPTGLCWNDAVDSAGVAGGCMCAQGGRGGTSICSTTPSGWCCFFANGFCGTQSAGVDNCGLICNYFNGSWRACAYGGDFNCCGGHSCVAFFGCLPMCVCLWPQHLAVSPGIISTCGAVVHFGTETDNEFSNWSGQGFHQSLSAVGAASRWPSMGVPFATCWGFSGGCGCYNDNSCIRSNPVGFPGAMPLPCPGVRDHGSTGGDGAIRIKFIAN